MSGQKDTYLHEGLAAVRSIGGATRQLRELEELIAARVLPRHPAAGTIAFEQLKHDLGTNSPIIKLAAAQELERRLGGVVNPNLISLQFNRLGGSDFEAVTNLTSFRGVSKGVATDIIFAAVSAVSDFNNRLEKMSRYTCSVGTRQNELPIFAEKLAVVARSFDPDAQAERFRRVLEITDLPNLQPQNVDLSRVLDVRASRESHEFRDWLWTADSLSSADIREQVASLRSRLGMRAQGTKGKVLRWAVSTGIGAIPVAGPLLGPAAGLADAFLLEKVLPTSGVVTFLGDQYPSLFKRGTA